MVVVYAQEIEVHRNTGCSTEEYLDLSSLEYTHGWGKSCTKVVLL
jgi:hypothetical protein